MCNRYGFQHPISRLAAASSEARLRLDFPHGIPNLEPREHIRPTNAAPVLRPVDPVDAGAGLELADLRWWLIPSFHKKSVKEWKAMCTNARAETVATTPTFREAFKRRRCLVPASHFFEWTGPKGDKTMWKFTRNDADLFCFAGLWDRAHTTDGEVQSFTIVTTAAGPDAAPYHDRQPVLLERHRWRDWLNLEADASDLLGPSPAGAITVQRAEAVAELG